MNFGRLFFQLSAPFLAAVLIGHADHTWASCGADGCPLDLSGNSSLNNPELTMGPRLNLQAAFESVDQNQPWEGHSKVHAGEVVWGDEEELDTKSQNLRLLANYTLTPRWSVRAGLPIVHRFHSHIDHTRYSRAPADSGRVHGQLEEWGFTRPGDLTVWGRYKLWGGDARSRTSLAAGLGINLPTGQTKVRNEEGEEAELSLQPGRGALGFLFEMSLQHLQPDLPSFSGNRPARLFATTFYRLNLKGEEGYRVGGEWLLHAGWQYPLFSRVDFLGQLVTFFKGQDAPGDSEEEVEATGSTSVYLSPGAQVEIAPGLSFYGYYQMAVYHNVHEIQLKANRNLLLGVGYSIR